MEWADKKPNRVVIICSCPSRIDDDETIMRKVEEMCNGKGNVELTFSEAGNAASALFESMTISGGGGSGARASVVMEVDPINTGKYRVKNVVINDGGSGYTSVPTVTFEAPDSGNQSVDDAYRFLEEFDETYE